MHVGVIQACVHSLQSFLEHFGHHLCLHAQCDPCNRQNTAMHVTALGAGMVQDCAAATQHESIGMTGMLMLMLMLTFMCCRGARQASLIRQCTAAGARITTLPKRSHHS